MDNLYNQKTTNNINVFDNRFLSGRNLYMHYFSLLPNINYISSVDGEKAYRAFKEKYESSIQQVHQYHWYKHKDKKYPHRSHDCPSYLSFADEPQILSTPSNSQLQQNKQNRGQEMCRSISVDSVQ